jgi:hypothetical protein
MSHTSHASAGNDYWGRDSLAQTIVEALAALGKPLDPVWSSVSDVRKV